MNPAWTAPRAERAEGMKQLAPVCTNITADGLPYHKIQNRGAGKLNVNLPPKTNNDTAELKKKRESNQDKNALQTYSHLMEINNQAITKGANIPTYIIRTCDS